MGKAYQPEQRARVKELLETGRDEGSIEKETGVSDRTIRRWKLELERTGRIGKPPESRTGRHRVLSAEVESALFEHVKDKPDMSVDDMLWWLYETFKVVVGTRTIRRVFERKGETGNRFKKARQSTVDGEEQTAQDDTEMTEIITPEPPRINDQFQAQYAPMTNIAPSVASQADLHLAQALQQQQHVYPPPPTHSEIMADMGDDEETLQLQLQQIALQKKEVELKLKMRRLQTGRSPGTSSSARKPSSSNLSLSSLYKPGADSGPAPPKRDSRSKKKIEESKRRTAERQERMLRDLERRSRRRDHLTAEWVQSKDIWPVRAQATLADLMHQYRCYAFSQSTVDAFEGMYRDLYQLVDLSSGDWDHSIHDDMLRDRMKRKMGQLRAKMQKTGEIIGRGDAFGSGWTKAEDYTGQQVRDMNLDETDPEPQHDLQAQGGALVSQPTHDDTMQYEPVPDPTGQQLQHAQMPYGNAPLLHHTSASAYPLMDSHTGLMQYGQLPPQPIHQDSMGL